MRKILIALLILISFGSCKSSKRPKNSKKTSSKIITKKADAKSTAVVSINETTPPSNSKETPEIIFLKENLIDYAKSFEGVKYRWGGTTKSGMDCSGLVFESFKAYNIYLPRISRDMAKHGEKISLDEVNKGDLLFFKTGNNRRNSINHVGLVINSKNGSIEFIHATTKRGVIVSFLSENYWNSSFFEARRVL